MSVYELHLGTSTQEYLDTVLASTTAATPVSTHQIVTEDQQTEKSTQSTSTTAMTVGEGKQTNGEH